MSYFEPQGASWLDPIKNAAALAQAQRAGAGNIVKYPGAAPAPAASGLPGWVLPAGILGAAAAIALVLRKKKRR